jgi:hypothetical protein
MFDAQKQAMILPVGRYTRLMVIYFITLLLLFTLAVALYSEITQDTLVFFSIVGVIVLTGAIFVHTTHKWVLTLDVSGIHWRAWRSWSLAWQDIEKIELQNATIKGMENVSPLLSLVDKKAMNEETSSLILTDKNNNRFALNGSEVSPLVDVAKFIRTVQEKGWQAAATERTDVQKTVDARKPTSLLGLLGWLVLLLVGMVLSALAAAGCMYLLGLEINGESAITQLFMLSFLGVYVGIVVFIKKLWSGKKKQD